MKVRAKVVSDEELENRRKSLVPFELKVKKRLFGKVFKIGYIRL